MQSAELQMQPSTRPLPERSTKPRLPQQAQGRLMQSTHESGEVLQARAKPSNRKIP
jgi:hypothetical protein